MTTTDTSGRSVQPTCQTRAPVFSRRSRPPRRGPTNAPVTAGSTRFHWPTPPKERPRSPPRKHTQRLGPSMREGSQLLTSLSSPTPNHRDFRHAGPEPRTKTRSNTPSVKRRALPDPGRLHPKRKPSQPLGECRLNQTRLHRRSSLRQSPACTGHRLDPAILPSRNRESCLDQMSLFDFCYQT
jgi:hypothetical protein